MKPQSPAIFGFNGLRGICVILVYLSHKCELRFFAAAMGVWLFLVLSGFLIIGELHRQRLKIEAGAYTPREGLRIFFIKRALRIFPAYYALLIVLFIFQRFYAWAGPDLGFRYHFAYVSNVFFGYVTKDLGGPFGVLWTLSVEQQFYVIAPFAFLLTPARYHIRLCLAVTAAAAVGHAIMTAIGVNPTAIYMTSPWNLAIIALGGAAGLSLRDQRKVEQLRSSTVLGWCLAVMAVFAASWLIHRSNDPAMLPLFAVTFALVGLVGWIFSNQDSAIVRGLEWPPLRYLGVISYGFYLIHNFIPNPLGRALPLYLGISVPPIVTLTLGAAIGFLISFGLAHLSWMYFESPILAARDKLLKHQAGDQERALKPAD